MTAGRPTKYTDEIREKVIEYLDSCFEIKDDEITVKKLPNIAGLAVYLHVSRSSVYKWKEENEEFSYILEELLATQEDVLLNNGLTGKFNSTIVKLILTKHDYSDKHEHSGANGEPMMTLVQFVDGKEDNKNTD